MQGFEKLSDLPDDEQNRLRWLLRHADENGIVEAGVAVKYGRAWFVNRDRLPDFLRQQTLAAIGRSAAR